MSLELVSKPRNFSNGCTTFDDADDAFDAHFRAEFFSSCSSSSSSSPSSRALLRTDPQAEEPTKPREGLVGDTVDVHESGGRRVRVLL